MDFEVAWKYNVSYNKQRLQVLVERFHSPDWRQSEIRGSLTNSFAYIALENYRNDKFSACKSYFSHAAMVAEYCFHEYHNNWPYWNMKPYTYALLSDHQALIDRYARLHVDEVILYPNDKKAQPAYWNYLISGILSDDEVILMKGFNQIQKEFISKNKEVSISTAHLLCSEGLLENNESKVRDGLHKFDLKRNKKRFIDNDICEEILSFFPLAYAKIAWLKGMEIDPGSPYMPIELLRVAPLEEYTIPYWFLRDWYRDQGVDWRYDPLYPELQNWDNDPENPNKKKDGFFKRLFKG